MKPLKRYTVIGTGVGTQERETPDGVYVHYNDVKDLKDKFQYTHERKCIELQLQTKEECGVQLLQVLELLQVSLIALKQVDQINDNPSTFDGGINAVVKSALEAFDESDALKTIRGIKL